jgi:CheY-like chemotaxis protein
MNYKILIIEDEDILGEILVKKLSDLGHEVRLVGDGAQGYAALQKWKPNLLLLDILLPSMNGYEILEAMRKEEDLREIPVIVISNSGQPVELERVIAMGAKDYLIKAQFDPDEVIRKVTKYIESTKKETPASAAADPRVLIVEDDLFLRELLVKKLEDVGYHLLIAADGEEALKIAGEQKPDLILLDVVMPQKDGFETLKELRQNPELTTAKVIIFSNLSQETDIQKAKELGADEFLVKSDYTLSDLAEKIRQLTA